MRHYTEKQKQHWLTEWELSGLSIRKFVEGKPFSLASFHNWIRKSRGAEKESSFIQVRPAVTLPMGSYARLTYPSGVVLEFHEHIDIPTLKALVQ